MSLRILGALAAAMALLAGPASADTAPAHPIAAHPITAPPPAVTAVPVPVLVQRYLAWRGGAPFIRAKNLHGVGAVEAYGLTGAFTLWQSPDHWRTEFNLGDVHVTTVTTKTEAWTTNASGQVVNDPDAYKYASRDPQSGDSLTGKDGASVRGLGLQSLDDATWEVVRVQFGDADTYDEYFDPGSGALAASRIVEKGQTRTERYTDWRWVGPVRMPFITRVDQQELGKQTLRATSYEIDHPIDPALFQRPAGATLASFAGGAKDTGWIPIQGLDKSRVYLPATVDGHPVTALFDTGATSSLVDKGVAAALAHTAEGDLPVPGENGVGAGSLERGIDLGLGPLTLKGVTVGVIDLAALNRDSGEPWLAVLGDEVFNETVVDFDFPGGRIAFRDPEGYQPPPGAVEVKLARDDNTRLVPLSIEGGPTAYFVMDTGYGANMRLSPGLAAAQHLLDGRLSTDVVLGAIGGDARATQITLKSLTIGGVTLPPVPVHVSDTWPSASFTTKVQGLLGLGVLERFRVIVDWPRDKLFLLPRADAATAPFPHDRLGLSLSALGGEAVVTGVYPHSPAEAAGLRAGARIALINGAPAAQALGIGGSAAGTQVTLTLAGAPTTPQTLVLRDYY